MIDFLFPPQHETFRCWIPGLRLHDACYHYLPLRVSRATSRAEDLCTQPGRTCTHIECWSYKLDIEWCRDHKRPCRKGDNE